MSEGYSILVDTSKCTACRGCQVACKEWNQLPGVPTKNVGSHENPQELSAATWKILRFSEGKQPEGQAFWHFFSEQCRHCVSPGCMEQSEKDEVLQDEKTGAVLFTPKTKDLKYEATRKACPYDIPRKDEKTGALVKCTMCFDRITNNMEPACVKTCPTDALEFGPREKILDAAKKRVAELKKNYPKAAALNADDVRVIYLVTDDPKTYWKFAAGK